MTASNAAAVASIQRLRRSMCGTIDFARRQAKKTNTETIELMLDELMDLLHRQDYRCVASAPRSGAAAEATGVS